MPRLTPSMSLRDFENGYWYATELAAFARRLGLPRGRKDQLEQAIRTYLATGRKSPPPFRPPPGPPDVVRLDARVVRYRNSPATKAFLEREARKLDPAYRRRSGARYRLNRWRDAKLAAGRRITYRDLVREYVRLSMQAAPFAKVPHGRYINFLADYLKREGGTHAQARAAWHALKELDAPKTYAGWRQPRHSNRSGGLPATCSGLYVGHGPTRRSRRRTARSGDGEKHHPPATPT